MKRSTVGQRLVFLVALGGQEGLGRNRKAAYKCSCGNLVTAREQSVKSGNTKSCGCLLHDVLLKRNAKMKTHGLSKSPEYTCFRCSKSRCNNPKDKDYHNYGGRGIEFKFNSFEQFFKELGLKPSKGHSVDRIDNDGPYAPGNVKWSTAEEQANNRKRSVDLENYTLLVAYAKQVMGEY